MCSQILEHFKQTDVHWHNFDCSFSPVAAKLREIYCDTKFSFHMNEYRTKLVKEILNHVPCEKFQALIWMENYKKIEIKDNKVKWCLKHSMEWHNLNHILIDYESFDCML